MQKNYQPVNLPNEFPGGFYVCTLSRPRRLLFANAEVLRLFDCHDFGELTVHIQNNVENMLMPEDIKQVHSQIERQLSAKGTRFEHICARIVTHTGRPRYVDISGCVVHSLEEGDLLYCLMLETGNRASDYQIDKDIREYVIENIDTALSRGWIHLYYQPVVRTLTGDLCGFEVLSRWIDPKIGFLSPGMFIPALEQTRQIHKLDTYILKETCRTIRSRMDKGLPTVPVSFNLSRVDFMLLDVFDMIESTMTEFRLPRDLLHIEVTESVVAEDPGHIRATMDRLRDEGYEVWIDDFGSGYSSLNLLKDVNCDLIKLDMGFLRTFTEKSRQIIASTISMAKKLGIKTLMEGVETSEQADFLASIGCGRLQGYFFGKPQPLEGAFSHMKAAGAGIETRLWHHYYDMAASAIHETDEPLTLLEFAGGKFHFLYTNAGYREQVKSIHYTVRDIEASFNDNVNAPLYRDIRSLVHATEESGRRETYFCTIANNYIRTVMHVVAHTDGHTLFCMSSWNITQDSSHMENQKFDDNLRYLYMMFDSIYIVDFDADTVNQIREKSAFNLLEQGCENGIRKMTEAYGRALVYEDDLEAYQRYVAPETILQRLHDSPDGILNCCLRLKDRHGSYNWMGCSILLIPEAGSRKVAYTARSFDDRADNIAFMVQSMVKSDAAQKGTHLSPAPGQLNDAYKAMLWDSQQRNSEFCYFWKDTKRRFLGVSHSFLRYYGFDSAQDVLGRTDEDMGWHVDDGPYRDAELEVLQKGRVIQNQPGQCIIRGVLHHITCYKWPLYNQGRIVGLMGVFFDADKMRKRIRDISETSYDDPVTGLMNARGWADAMFSYDEQRTLQKRQYSVLLIENASYDSVVSAYGMDIARQLLQREADAIRKMAGRRATIARTGQATFALLTYDKDEDEARKRASDVLRALNSIHEIAGNPVTLVFRYAIAHSREKGVSTENIYHIAQDRLHQQQKTERRQKRRRRN